MHSCKLKSHWLVGFEQVTKICSVIVCAGRALAIGVNFHSKWFCMLTSFDTDQSIISHECSMSSKLCWVGRVHGIKSMINCTMNTFNIGNSEEMSTLLMKGEMRWDEMRKFKMTYLWSFLSDLTLSRLSSVLNSGIIQFKRVLNSPLPLPEQTEMVDEKLCTNNVSLGQFMASKRTQRSTYCIPIPWQWC